MALIEQLTDYTHADVTVPKLYRQSQIDAGTLASYDFRDLYTYGQPAALPASMAAGASLASMIDDALPAVVGGAAVPIGTTGLTMTGQGESVTLPAAGKFAAGATRFGFGGWIKHADNAGATGVTCTLAGCTTTNVAPANVQWVIANSRGSVNYQAQSAGTYSAPVPVAIGEVAHIFFSAVIENGTITWRSWKNGVLHNTASSAWSSALPVPAGPPLLGKVPGTAAFAGQIGSFDVEDFSIAGSATPEVFVATAYGDNVGRFT